MAVAAITLKFLKGYETLLHLRGLLGQPSWVENKLMKGIGTILLKNAQKAFRDQRFGDEEWKERYPNQGEPKVNIAGVVADFLEGKKNPPERRFDRRPAGMDTGLLLRSLTPGRAMQARGYTVTVGSTMKNAAAVQEGGAKHPSRQQITQEVKGNLSAWRKRELKKLKKAGKEGGVFKKQKGQRVQKATTLAQALKLAAIDKLGFLFQRKELITKQAARPYLGIHNQGQKEIVDFISDVFRQAGSSTKVKVTRA